MRNPYNPVSSPGDPRYHWGIAAAANVELMKLCVGTDGITTRNGELLRGVTQCAINIDNTTIQAYGSGKGIRGLNQPMRGTKSMSILDFDDFGSVDNVKIIHSPNTGPTVEFCKEYACPRLCQNKKSGNYGCGKNGGLEINGYALPYQKCSLGAVWHALDVMKIKPKDGRSPNDPLGTVGFINPTDYKKKLQHRNDVLDAVEFSARNIFGSDLRV